MWNSARCKRDWRCERRTPKNDNRLFRTSLCSKCHNIELMLQTCFAVPYMVMNSLTRVYQSAIEHALRLKGQSAYLLGQLHGHSEVVLDGLGGRGLLLLLLVLVLRVGGLGGLELGGQLGLGGLLLPFPEFPLPPLPFPDFAVPPLLLDPLLLPLFGLASFPGVKNT